MAIANHERIGKALAYNGLVRSSPEITHLARVIGEAAPAQVEMFAS